MRDDLKKLYLPMKRKRQELMRAMRDKGRTLHEIGITFGLTRERVRQILNEKL